MEDLFNQQNASLQDNASPFASNRSFDTEDNMIVEREQFVGLLIGSEEFFLSIAAINDIVMLPPITYVPLAQKYIEGVINLRGQIVPAVNLRKMMNLPRSMPTSATRIVIIEHEGSLLGLIADAITNVVALAPQEIENHVFASQTGGLDLIGQISKRDQKVTGILDLGKIIQGVAGKPKENTEELEATA